MLSLPAILLLATLLASSVLAQGAYNCPASCTIQNGCFCASQSIPGGLTPDQTPMFITLTLDDAIQPQTYDAFMRVQNSATNPNGCRIPATYFMCNLFTDYWSGQRTYAAGNEIASHTVSHIDLANLTNTDERRVLAEIYENWSAINSLSGVPANELNGFRHPFLAYNRKTYDAIYELRRYIKYESSVVLNPVTQGWWPHTLDYGMPYNPPNCINCEEGSRWVYPGMWVIPMYALMTNTNPPAIWSSMDFPIDPARNASYEEAVQNLQASFRLHYDKRLPFGLYQHVAQNLFGGLFSNALCIHRPADVQARKLQIMLDFVRWTQTEFQNVWYVTNAQLLQWMANPRPVSEVGSMFTCEDNVDYKQEVCDGFDNNENGSVDENLVLTCTYGNTSFQSCFGCPSQFPSVTTSIENLSGDRGLVPDEGCPRGTGPWDPVRKVCARSGNPGSLTRTRLTLSLSTAIGTATGGQTGVPVSTVGTSGPGSASTKGSGSGSSGVILQTFVLNLQLLVQHSQSLLAALKRTADALRASNYTAAINASSPSVSDAFPTIRNDTPVYKILTDRSLTHIARAFAKKFPDPPPDISKVNGYPAFQMQQNALLDEMRHPYDLIVSCIEFQETYGAESKPSDVVFGNYNRLL
ncbi:hypothetical protein HDU67_010267 [Dinochytrium kinnereticum]|nr:hypothetical protein HDU67_010267 [Dinochytrium kinnereticum]